MPTTPFHPPRPTTPLALGTVRAIVVSQRYVFGLFFFEWTVRA